MSKGEYEHPASYHALREEEVREIRSQLVTWFKKNRRPLPWRGDAPPYGSHTKTTSSTPSSSFSRKRKRPAAASASSSSNGKKKQGTLLGFFKRKAPKATPTSSPSKASSTPPGSAESKDEADREETKAKTSPAGPLSTDDSTKTTASSDDSKDGLLVSKLKPDAKIIPVTPYSVWVSEIMCQQTRVDTVVDYFLRWMEKFPTAQDLAKASLEEVNQVWAGLGYYRRAKFLHEGAKKVVTDLKGVFPRTVSGLKGIPGIGDYTAGAIASIAFGVRAPLVDGNVIRVLSRLRAIAAAPQNSQALKLHWKLAGELVPEEEPGVFNEALMEFGAMVCTPQLPQCTSCPLQSVCHAHKESSRKRRPHVNIAYESCGGSDSAPSGTPKSSRENKRKRSPSEAKTDACDICAEEFPTNNSDDKFSVLRFPLKAVKKAPREEHVLVGVFARPAKSSKTSSDGKTKKRKFDASKHEYLLVKRPSTGLLAGQWEFPQFVVSTTAGVKKKTSKSSKSSATGKQSYAKRKSSFDKTFAEKFAVNLGDGDTSEVTLRNDMGSFTHIFSHIRQQSHCELFVCTRDFSVSTCSPLSENSERSSNHSKRCKTSGDSSSGSGASSKSPSAELETRWVSHSEFRNARASSLGLTKGVHKAFALVAKHGDKLDLDLS